MKKKMHTKWNLLYFLLALCMIPMFFETKLKLTEKEHEFFEMGIVLISYGVVWIWLNANECSIMMDNKETYQTIQSQLGCQDQEANLTPKHQSNPIQKPVAIHWVLSPINGFWHKFSTHINFLKKNHDSKFS